MKNINQKEKENFLFAVIIISTLAVFAFSTKIFYCYINDIYKSDFPSHIKTVLEGNPQYSLAHKLIGICYKFPHSDIVFSVVVGMLIIGTAGGMWLYINRRLSGGGESGSFGIANLKR